MIEIENMFEDLRSDEVGRAINALRSRQRWDAEKYELRDRLFAVLMHQSYVKLVGTRAQLCMSGGIGFSYLYHVPKKKKGRFGGYAEKLLRLVYYASAKHYLEIRFGVVGELQRGRCFTTFEGVVDPRANFKKVHGESEHHAWLDSNTCGF